MSTHPCKPEKRKKGMEETVEKSSETDKNEEKVDNSGDTEDLLRTCPPFFNLWQAQQDLAS